jgi:Ca2+-binding EF-hand superfamily protein
MADKIEKVKEFLKDPAKVEQFLQRCWAVADKEKKGYITFPEFEKNCKALMGTTKEPTAEEREKLRKLVDPQNTNKVTYEAFKKAVNIIIEELKKQGKL